MRYLSLFLLNVYLSVQAQEVPTPVSGGFDNIGFPQVINYSNKEYKGNLSNFCAIQDNNGLMYFGNLWAVLQFDGTVWNKIYLPNGISCTSFAKDETGTIYVGGRNEIGYLKNDSLGRKFYVSLINRVPPEGRTFSEVWNMFSTPQGILFVSREALLFKPNGKDEIQLLRKNITSAFYVDNEIWVLDNDGISVYKNNTFQKVGNSQLLGNVKIRDIQSIQHKLFFATDDGVFVFDGENYKPWNASFNKEFKASKIDKILITPDNRLVFTTLFNGVIVTDFTTKVLLHLTKSSGLLSNSISGVFLDRNNNIWLTSYAGISYVPLSTPFTYINDLSGISGIPYGSAIYKGSLYLSTSEGLFRRSLFPGAFVKTFEKVKEFNDLIWNLYVFDNKLFFGQGDEANQFDGYKIEPVINEGTWLFLPVNDGKLILIGTYKGLAVLEKRENKWQYRNHISGFSESSRYVVEDKFGDFWVSHGNKGVYRLRLDKLFTKVSELRFYGKKDGLPFDFDNTVYKIDNEILITGSTGVYKFDFENEQIKLYQPLANAVGANNHLERLLMAGGNQLWVVQNGGILSKYRRLQKDSFKLLWKTKRMQDNWIQSFEHLNQVTDKLLVLGTQEGFSLLNISDSLSQSGSTFTCYINKVEVNTPINEIIWNGYVSDAFNIKNPLPYSKRSIMFSFTAPFFEDVHNIQYQFYLDGFGANDKWSTPGIIPFKEYTNLKEGKYVFHVRAINSDEKISTENMLSFEILPPWYRTFIAYVTYFFLTIAVLFFTWRLIRKWIEKEKKKIEIMNQRELFKQQLAWKEAALEKRKMYVKLEHEAIEAEALALQERELLIGQKKEREREILEIQQQKLELDLSAKNNELTSLTIHISQKNEVLSKIKDTVNKAINDTGDEKTKLSLAKIEQLIDKNLNSDKEWEQFTEHFDIVHEGFLKKLQDKYPDLKTSSLKLCAYIKMNLSAKQIGTLMNTEPESVNKARYRLRQRFNLDKDISLEGFLNGHIDG